jgi:KDO2-lipid IV(A) lauroyltransferase
MILRVLLQATALLPLGVLHFAGAAVGRMTRRLSPRFRRLLSENLARSGLAPNPGPARERLERRVAAEIGKGLLELPAVWFRSPRRVERLVVDPGEWQLVDDALRHGRGLLFLTPHLGCFEIAATYAALRLPLTVLYRPPKLPWLEPLMRAARTRGQGRVAPTSLSGVRRLLKALRSGEAVGVLPDQVPGFGEGAWAPFFGRMAYTMTLIGRLQKATGCAVILACSHRLPGGRGFRLEFEAVAEDLDGPEGPARLNRAVERVIRRCPEQYLWSYNRYKVPAGVMPPVQRESR